MQNITIGRYKACPEPLPEGVVAAADYCNGWIEGIRDDGSTWIMFFDAHGGPELYWAEREESGAVVGDPVNLRRESDGTDQPS